LTALAKARSSTYGVRVKKLLLALLLVGCQSASAPPAQPIPPPSASAIKTSSGLSYEEPKVGTGAEATKGKQVAVHYTGWLQSTGAEFDSSRKRGQPFEFKLGAGNVILGWDEGVAGMKVGGQRRLFIPPELGYGSRGAGGVIPGNATLVFDVELMGVRD